MDIDAINSCVARAREANAKLHAQKVALRAKFDELLPRVCEDIKILLYMQASALDENSIQTTSQHHALYNHVTLPKNTDLPEKEGRSFLKSAVVEIEFDEYDRSHPTLLPQNISIKIFTPYSQSQCGGVQEMMETVLRRTVLFILDSATTEREVKGEYNTPTGNGKIRFLLTKSGGIALLELPDLIDRKFNKEFLSALPTLKEFLNLITKNKSLLLDHINAPDSQRALS